MSRLRHAWLAAGLLAALPAGAPAAPGPQAGPPQAPPPTAAIVGRVTGDLDGQPLSRARIVVTSPALPEPRVEVSGLDGSFRVGRLPAGDFSLAVSKSGYVSSVFGLAATGSPFAISLTAGQQTAPIEIRLAPAGVIAGRILDSDGTPFEGAQVEALRYQEQDGLRTLVSIGQATTDDLGAFRIVGLPAGLYYVSAMDPAYAAVGDNEGALEYSPTYHPGVVFPDEATRVKVDGGRVASGVEFRLEIVRPSRVSGRIAASDRRQLLSGAVIMTVQHGDRLSALPVRDVKIRPDGTFEFRNVPPGRYVIRARGQTEREGLSLFGRFAIEVSGRDVANIDITLTPGARVSGRLDFEGRPRPRREAIEGLRVHAIAVDGVAFGDAYSDPIDADGRFEFRGVMPGAHVLRLERLPDGWSMRSVYLMGREVTDTPLTLDAGQVLSNLQIVATDVETVVSGRITGGSGRARPDAIVVAFPADPGLWVPYSRHVRRARPDLDGHYRLRGLPPGEYLIVATDEIDESDLLGAETLERLSAPADRLTLAAGQRKTLDLVVKGLHPEVGIGDRRPAPEPAP